MFSCLSNLKSLSYLRVLLAKILWSKTLSIFLIATYCLFLSYIYRSLAATTVPYAPCPTIINYSFTHVDYLISLVNFEFFARFYCYLPFSLGVSVRLIHIDYVLTQFCIHLLVKLMYKLFILKNHRINRINF